jgi:hypothetical protein
MPRHGRRTKGFLMGRQGHDGLILSKLVKLSYKYCIRAGDQAGPFIFRILFFWM